MKATPNTIELAKQLKDAMNKGMVDYIHVHQDINTKGEEHTLGNIEVSRFKI